MNYADAKAEYDAAMADMQRVTARVARASAALTEAAVAQAGNFRSHGDPMVNVTSGNARVGIVAGTLTGGVSVSGDMTVIGGRHYDGDGSYFLCRFCRPSEGGDRGWVIADGVVTHQRCGRVQ